MTIDETDIPFESNGSAADGIVATPPWLHAQFEDLGSLDFEAPIADCESVCSHDLSGLYRRAAELADPCATSENRIYLMLSAIMDMRLKAHERDDPFGPMFLQPTGGRSAIPADFREQHVELIAELAMRAKRPVLGARLADVAWLLDRKKGKLGAAAVTAYVDIIEELERRTIDRPAPEEDSALDHDTANILRRALCIGRAIGWDRPESQRARDAVIRLRKQAVAVRAGASLLWFGELDLDNHIDDPTAVSLDVEEVLVAVPEITMHLRLSLWRLAARGYHDGKRDDDKHRCQTSAAETMVAEARRVLTEGRRGTAMMAAELVSKAIAQLHGVPAMKERRIALKHELVDIQARIPDEMSAFALEFDFKEAAAKISQAMGEGLLLEQLFVLAAIAKSPDPTTLIADAEKSIRQNPLSTLFDAIHYDREGKIVHRSEGASFAGLSISAIRRQIGESESIRRKVDAAKIEIARQAVMAGHFLSEDFLVTLLQQSAFVPQELTYTFSRGFLRFFQGDLTSAAYILTPLLENSLRHVMKMHGHDVTIFDDATQTQQDRTISALFEQMRSELDAIFTEAITTDIENVFLNRPGPYLRHSLAHGLAHDGTPYGSDAVYGCWLIFRLCLLPLFPFRDQLHQLLR